jgi:hypothetical protein
MSTESHSRGKLAELWPEALHLIDTLTQTDFFWFLLEYLDWRDVINLYFALPEIKETFFSPSARTIKIGRFARKRKFLNLLKGVRMNFDTLMLLWHWTEHVSDEEENDLTKSANPRYELGVDGFLPWPVTPYIAPRVYQVCAFFPPEAPDPFKNGLVVVDGWNQLRVFKASVGAYILLEDTIKCVLEDVQALTISPLGTTMILFSFNERVHFYKISPHKMERFKTNITFTARLHPVSIFASENTFIHYDANWDFWIYEFYPECGAMSKRFFHASSVSTPFRYSPMYGKVLNSLPGYSAKDGLEYLYVPAADGNDNLLFIHDNCAKIHYRTAKHLFQIISRPDSSDPRVFFGNLNNCKIIGSALDARRRRIFIAVTTRMNEKDFYSKKVSISNATSECGSQPGFVGSWIGYSNLGVYSIDLEVGCECEARFFMPSSVTELEGVTPVGSSNLMGLQFFPWETDDMSVEINRLFLLVRYNQRVLCFPLDGAKKTRPFALHLAIPFELFATTAEMNYICSLPDSGLCRRYLSLSCFCPDNSGLYQVEAKSLHGNDADNKEITILSHFLPFF